MGSSNDGVVVVYSGKSHRRNNAELAVYQLGEGLKMRGVRLSILLILGALLSTSEARANDPCTRLLLVGDFFIGPHRVLSFTSAKDVENLLGDTGLKTVTSTARLARDFFSDTSNCVTKPAVLEVTRFATVPFRPHLGSADLTKVPTQSCASAGPGCGTNVVSIDVNGTTVRSANIDLRGSPSKSEIARLIETSLQANRPLLATTTSSTITPASVGPFQAYGQRVYLMITSGGPIPLGSEVSDYPQPPALPCCTLAAAVAGKHSCMPSKQLMPNPGRISRRHKTSLASRRYIRITCLME